MILTHELEKTLHQHLLKKLCCPVCLSNLFYVPDNKIRFYLGCDSCGNSYPVVDGLPYFLIEDENVKQKADEIYGEENYNRKIIPPEVHIQRNAFVNRNTDLFLQETGIDLSKADILIVGCSMAELDFFAQRSKFVTALDIVPSLVKEYLKTSREKGVIANWICGDGECLPFEDECFDAVIVRQTLHHMLKYYSTICEFFRVCKRGGSVLIVDEPFSPPDVKDILLQSLPDGYDVYEGLAFEQIRKKLMIPLATTLPKTKDLDIRLLERNIRYIEPDQDTPGTFLADKYHAFSLLNCILALHLHSKKLKLDWPREVAWTDETGETIRFCHGPNPNYYKSLLDKLTRPGNVSIAIKKSDHTTVRRNRSELKTLSIQREEL